MTCPNGHGLTLGGHTIDPDGTVHASVVCPVRDCSSTSLSGLMDGLLETCDRQRMEPSTRTARNSTPDAYSAATEMESTKFSIEQLDDGLRTSLCVSELNLLHTNSDIEKWRIGDSTLNFANHRPAQHARYGSETR